MRTRRTYFLALAAVVALGLTPTPASAQTYTWTDAGTTNWASAGNWTPTDPSPSWTEGFFLFSGAAVFGPQATITNNPTIAADTIYALGVSFDNSGGASWQLSGTTGVLNLGANGLSVIGGTTVVSANVNLTTAQTWTISSAGTLRIGDVSNAGLLTGEATLTKAGNGTLILDNALTSRFGGVVVTGGTLQAGSAVNLSASQVLRSNPVSLASGTNLTTVGTTAANSALSVGQLSGSGGSVTPGSNGSLTILSLGDATFSGSITTSGGLFLRGNNGTTQTFDGNLTGLTGTVGVNSGATLRLSGTGATTGVVGASTINPRGGTLTLDNSGGNTAAAAGRLSDAATVTFSGGTLSLLGHSSGTTETVGPLTLRGAATISVTHSGGGGTVLAFTDSGTLRDSTAMTVNFVGVGGTLGSAGANPRITFSGAVFTGTATGLLSDSAGSDTTIGWATVNGTEWAGIGANGITALSPTVMSGTNTGIQSATSTSLVLFNPVASQTLTAAVTSATFKIEPGAGSLNLNIGTNNLSTFSLMLAGSTDFTITGTTGRVLTGGSTSYVHVTTANTVLTFDGTALANAQPVTKSGAGTLALAGSINMLPFTSNQNVNIVQGTLRGSTTTLGGGTSAGGANTTLNLRGGVLEISGGGSFSRALDLAGTGAGGGLTFDGGSSDRGDGGFSAISGNATVTLVTTIGGGTSASLQWNNGAFLADGYALLFGSTRATSVITLTNNIALNDGATTNGYSAREFRVFDNTGSSSDAALLSGVLSGSLQSDLLKTGDGTLILTATNTYAGNTLIQGGTLQIGNAGFTGTLGNGSGLVVIGSGGILAFNRTNTYAVSNPISGAGSLRQTGSGGTTVLVATNTYTGGTTITAGTLQIGDPGSNGGTTGSIVGNVSASSGTLLRFNRSDDLTYAGNVSGSGSLEQAGSGVLTLTGTNTHTGGTTISAGTLQLGDGNSTGSVAGNITNDGTLTFNRSDDITYSGVITGSGSVTHASSGALTLTGASNYSGGTTITTGNLFIGNGGTTGSITGDVTNGGGLNFNRSNSFTFAGNISGGDVNQNGSGTVTLSGTIEPENLAVNSGTLILNGTASPSSFVVSVDTGATLGGTGTINGTVNVAPNGVIRGGTTVTTGTLNVAGLDLGQGGGNNATIRVETSRTGVNAANASRINATTDIINLNPGAGNRFRIDLVNGTPSLVAGETYTITLATTGGSGRFQLNGVTLGNGVIPATNYTLESSSFFFTGVSLQVSGNTNLTLTFTPTPIPEPGAVLGIACGVLGLGGVVRRRLRNVCGPVTA